MRILTLDTTHSGDWRQRFWQRLSSRQTSAHNVQHNHGEAPMRHFKGSFWLTVPALLLAAFAGRFAPDADAAPGPGQSPGSLEIIGKGGAISGICPLKHTAVRGAISGFVARVTVTQVFENPAQQNIEAVYVFPLPDNAAVDDMTIQIGDRTVRGLIKKREEARQIYEHAKATGHVAALLDQERPNIFTQSVANILPGEQVTVTISYLQTLDYENGSYAFVFPMVVGPRYIPGNATGKQAGGWAPDTDQVPDASKITPQVTPKGTRAGHDISLELAIDAGVPIQEIDSKLHEVDVHRDSATTATVKLRDEATIPNKDFILKYEVAGAKIEDAVLSQAAPSGTKLGPGGYFTLILQPPARVAASDVTPKELVFLVDTSGSMYGYPLDQAKKLINRALDELYPGDTFNLITFSGDEHVLFPEPVYPTAQNIKIAKNFLNGQRGGGGTEMMKAIRASLDPSDAQDHIRVVCFVTDGNVGNDMEIIGEIQKHPNARVFSFGIGNSVNRFLIEGMAKAGRGDSEIVTLNDKADVAAHRLYERLHAPLLTDVSVDWAGLPVTDIYPKRLPDLFSGKPLIITGRYTGAATGKIRLRGKQSGEDVVREIPVNFTSKAGKENVIPSFWARRKIDDLMSQDWTGMQGGSMKPALQNEITQLGLDYRLMTQFTSFVAVEERIVTKDGKPQRIDVPVEMPEGVSYEGVFGGEKDKKQYHASYGLTASPMVTNRAYSGAGVGAGFAGGVGGGAYRVAPGPPPPPASQTVMVESQSLSVDTEARADMPTSLKSANRERGVLESKLHPALLRAFDCWKKDGDKCKSVQAGKVRVQIVLATTSNGVLDQLKALGFEVQPKLSSRRVLVGNLPIDKLQNLAQMAQVTFVSLAS